MVARNSPYTGLDNFFTNTYIARSRDRIHDCLWPHECALFIVGVAYYYNIHMVSLLTHKFRQYTMQDVRSHKYWVDLRRTFFRWTNEHKKWNTTV